MDLTLINNEYSLEAYLHLPTINLGGYPILYRKTHRNLVEIECNIYVPNDGVTIPHGGRIVAQLPAGYIPADVVVFAGILTNTSVRITIDTLGNIVVAHWKGSDIAESDLIFHCIFTISI